MVVNDSYTYYQMLFKPQQLPINQNQKVHFLNNSLAWYEGKIWLLSRYFKWIFWIFIPTNCPSKVWLVLTNNDDSFFYTVKTRNKQQRFEYEYIIWKTTLSDKFRPWSSKLLWKIPAFCKHFCCTVSSFIHNIHQNGWITIHVLNWNYFIKMKNVIFLKVLIAFHEKYHDCFSRFLG
jgi:hypothetical protein